MKSEEKRYKAEAKKYIEQAIRSRIIGAAARILRCILLLKQFLVRREKVTPNADKYRKWVESSERKKVVWLGTSVPYGSNTYNGESYASYAAKKLGFLIVPAVVPGEAIHARIEDGRLEPLEYGSTVLSKAEYAASGKITIQDKPKTWQPGSEANEEHPESGYNDYYRTWENIFKCYIPDIKQRGYLGFW